MAAADYRLCDRCGSKVFYDANLNYEFASHQRSDFDEVDKKRGYKLDYLGDWICLCKECSEKYIIVTMDREEE